MQTKLNQAWLELESAKNEITTIIQRAPIQELNKVPAPEKWSILQIAAHLMSSENKSLIYMKKKLQAGANLPASNLASTFRAWLLRFFLKTPVRFKAPLTLDTPETNYDKIELIQRWNNQRNEMFAFLNQLPPELIYRDLFKHPVAGRMNIVQALRFMTTHARRHQKQMNEIVDLSK